MRGSDALVGHAPADRRRAAVRIASRAGRGDSSGEKRPARSHGTKRPWEIMAQVEIWCRRSCSLRNTPTAAFQEDSRLKCGTVAAYTS